jgi:cold shock CspA family protein
MTTDSVTSNTLESLTGRVKWFNNKAGYGFITVTDGLRSGTDVFVHHSSVNVSDQQYKYLVQGEYVQFTLSTVSTGSHQFQASSVSGINGGKLMCETRHEFKTARKSYKSTSEDNESGNEPVKQVRQPKTPRTRGEGPRDAEKGSWTVVVDKTAAPKPKGRGRPSKAHTSEEK